jgi:hypothetical protein
MNLIFIYYQSIHSAMTVSKRGRFYLGLIIITPAIILLAYILVMGPNTRIPETTIEIIYDSPNGPVFTDIEPGDSIELNYESTEPVNIILLRPENKGKYFILEQKTGYEYYIIAEDSTGGSFEHTFNSSGTWKIYFENPTPPLHPNPVVKYWGKLGVRDDDLLYFYLKITASVMLVILGVALLISSRLTKARPSDKNKKSNKK